MHTTVLLPASKQNGVHVIVVTDKMAGVYKLFQAVKNNQPTVVTTLLSSDSTLANCSYQGWKPLELAAKFGHADICNILIEHGAEVNYADKAGFTALHTAVQNGHSL